MNSRTILAALACVMSVGLAWACNTSDRIEADQSEVATTLQAFSEHVPAGNGVTVEIQYAPDKNNGGGVTIVSGPSAQKEKMRALISAKTIGELYRKASGKSTLPTQVASLEKKSKEATDVEENPNDFKPVTEKSVAPVVDDSAEVEKGVAEWEAVWCNRSQIDENLAPDTWFQRTDWCYPWAGGAAVYYANSVRQSWAILEAFVGSAQLQLTTKLSTSGTWGTPGVWTVPQGTWTAVRTWANKNNPVDVNFNVLDWQSGEIYGLAIQAADTPTILMTGPSVPKLLAGNDWYWITCDCPNGERRIYEACEPNSISASDATLTYYGNSLCANQCGSVSPVGTAYNVQRVQVGKGCPGSTYTVTNCFLPGSCCSCWNTGAGCGRIGASC